MNEKSLWSGGPSDSRPEYNGGNIESKGQNGKVMAQLKEKLKSGQGFDSNLAGQLIGVSDDAGVQGYGYYLSYGNSKMLQRITFRDIRAIWIFARR